MSSEKTSPNPDWWFHLCWKVAFVKIYLVLTALKDLWAGKARYPLKDAPVFVGPLLCCYLVRVGYVCNTTGLAWSLWFPPVTRIPVLQGNGVISTGSELWRISFPCVHILDAQQIFAGKNGLIQTSLAKVFTSTEETWFLDGWGRAHYSSLQRFPWVLLSMGLNVLLGIPVFWFVVERQLQTVWKCSWRALTHVNGMRSWFRVFWPAVVLISCEGVMEWAPARPSSVSENETLALTFRSTHHF